MKKDAFKFTKHSQRVIKNDYTNVGKEFIQTSLEESVKNRLIKPHSQTHYAREQSKTSSTVRLVSGYAYRKAENTLAHGGNDTGSRAAGQTAKYTLRGAVKASRAGIAGAALGFAAVKTAKGIKAGSISPAKAKWLAKRQGKKAIKQAGKATLAAAIRAAVEFQGDSDNIGIQAFTKPRNAILKTTRAVRITTRAGKAVINTQRRMFRVAARTPQGVKRTLRGVRQAAIRARQAAIYAARGVRAAYRTLTSPVALKGIAIAAAGGLIVLVLATVITAVGGVVASVFSVGGNATTTGSTVVVAPADGTRWARIKPVADKYLGMPYVWGGHTPSTSFDCSGYVSWVLTESGVKNIQATAQGLYDACTPISEAQAQPGDLIFFAGTYSPGPTVTHVGFYVGPGQMLDCSRPYIRYESYNTPYWRAHIYAFGRIK